MERQGPTIAEQGENGWGKDPSADKAWTIIDGGSKEGCPGTSAMEIGAS
jgi:hypothetical protein